MAFALWPRTRRGWIRAGLLLGIPLALGSCGACVMTSMPGRSHRGPLPEADAATRDCAARLEAHVRALAAGPGERNLGYPDRLREAERYVTEGLRASGLVPTAHEYPVGGDTVRNFLVEWPGTTTPGEIVVVGAHYDSVLGPAANDNGSGTAAVLELARLLAGAKPARTLRLLAFMNEEPPFFKNPELMGSAVYATACRRKGEDIVAMLSLETIGYYRDEPGTQKYPFPFGLLYPREGNFIAFVGNFGSRTLVRRCVGTFRAHAAFPSEGGAIPAWIPGVDWSDHWSFWREGYPALMVTDTAPFRYPYYHSVKDTPERIDYDRTARVVLGLRHVVADLSGIDK